MKFLIAALAILSLALAIPVVADINNGNINGTTDAWTINFGFVVSDSFKSDGITLTGFMIGVWLFPGDTLTSLDWSISSAEFGGTIFGSGTASGARITDTYISSNQYGYNIDRVTITGMNVPEVAGTTYWLNLANASVASGDPAYWDENSGPASASESALGTIPSEAYTINACGGCGCFAGGKPAPDCGDTPEPNSILLFGSGTLGLLTMLRRKLTL